MTAPHIVASYDQELHALTDLLARMGGQTEEQLNLALTALERRDEALAATVIARDAAVDHGEACVNTQVLRLLALRAPVADDLRRVLASLKIARALERIADHARRLARMVIPFNHGPALPLMALLLRMGRIVERQLHQVLNAYLSGDVVAATALCSQDEAVDSLDKTLFTATTRYMEQDCDAIPLCSQILLAGKTLERIGDHVTTIAEMTAYEAAGQTLCRPRKNTGHPLAEGA